jgi:hypothetical protein
MIIEVNGQSAAKRPCQDEGSSTIETTRLRKGVEYTIIIVEKVGIIKIYYLKR